MKRRSDRMQRVTDMAERHTESAAQHVAKCNQNLGDAQTQLEELRRFRKEYACMPNGNAAMSATALMNRQQFIHRIDQAIVQQQREIQRLARESEQARSHWLEKRSRSAALDGVTQRYREEERHADERQDQASIDERMQHRRNGWRES